MLTWTDVLQFTKTGNPEPDKRVEKTAEEWENLLDPETFRITRAKGTERPFSGEFCSRFEPGLYGCACCGEPLFDSHEKFESGTGWPSFTQPLKENAISYIVDHSHAMTRVEVCCNTCDAHLGHIFPDGPAPNGLRYCINSLSMKKIH